MAGVWFRKCLRLHDNEALLRAAETGDQVVPFFILDPWFDRSRIGVNRFQFLLQSLKDLDEQLRKGYSSRLLVFRGRPEEVLQGLFGGEGDSPIPIHLTSLFWEKDSEPYARERDARVESLARKCSVKTQSFVGHTLLDLEKTIVAKGFKPPISMAGIQNLMKAAGPIPAELPVPKQLPALRLDGFEVPDISELYTEEQPSGAGMLGGEREALRRLAATCSDVGYVCAFEKPKTASTGKKGKPWEPSTTALSPYLKFGCLSVRTAWHAFARCYAGRTHSQPPQSLHGQLLFREMFYVLGMSIPNWDKAEGNRMCKPIPWGEDKALIEAWTEGRTGYPFIDAFMRQLRTTGFMHHLGRHAVACFLTRGDLWQHWTHGRDVFDKYLLDSDWAVNNGNWLWLAGVAPFSAPYFRIYDPCPGPKSSLNAEQSGEFVKHFVPELKGMPAQYIYSPWKAPLAVQQKAGCIIGKDYPSPIVDHKAAREENLSKFKAALEGRRDVDDSSASSSKPPLPEKFGVGRKADPGPMKSFFASSSGGCSSKGKSSIGAASGKGKGRGGKRSAAGQDASPNGARVIDLESDSPQEQQQRKQRRWGNSTVGKGGEADRSSPVEAALGA